MRTLTNQNYISRCTASESVTVSDTVVNRYDAIFVGTGGDIALKLKDDTAAVTFVNIPDGTTLPFSTSYVMSTNTTASDIVGLII